MKERRRQVVIVGASAAGLRCACRLRRLQPNWPITVVEQSEVFSYAACGMPYVLSGDIDDADALRRTADGALRDPSYFAEVKGIKVHAGHRAVAIETAARRLHVLGPQGERALDWDELVLTTGARARQLPDQPAHPRVRSFHTFEDLAPLHEGLARGETRSVVIVGAGLVGCELAEAFAALWGVEVTLVEAGEAPLPDVLDTEVAALVTAAMEANGVRVCSGAPVASIEARDDGVTVTAGGEAITADIAVVAIGVEPNVALARRAGVGIGPTGAIAVDERLATTLPHLWAAGDCVEVRHAVTGAPAYRPLGSLANAQGRTLANVLAGRHDRLPDVAGAGALKVFDLNVAAAGVTRSTAERHWNDVRSVWISAHDRAHYWPEAEHISLHLVYDGSSRRILGVQAVGRGDVVKRVDVAAQLITRGATLADLRHLEHAYAPAYAPAVEPLAVAAAVAGNQLDGVSCCSPGADLEGVRLLDVRHEAERAARPIKGCDVKAVAQEDLHRRLDEFEAGSAWVVVCEHGTRSAEAVRLLRSRGIVAQYLGGGLHWRNAVRGERA